MRLRFVSALHELRHEAVDPLANLEVLKVAHTFLRLGDELIFRQRNKALLGSMRVILTGAEARLDKGVSALSLGECELLQKCAKLYKEMLQTLSMKQFSLIVDHMEMIYEGRQ